MNSCIRMKIEAETKLMKIEPVTYAEIDLKALAGNYRRLKALMAPTVRMAAVIKADAYGHGAVRTARTALNEGASFLIVARPEEAFELRAAGIGAPVLLLGALPPENAREAAAAGITLSVNGFDDARELSSRLGGASVKVHLKVDTGMGRLGFSFNEFSADISDALRTVRSVASLPGVELEGLYTHFASADAAEEETAFCLTQFDSFSRLIRILEKENLRPPICHCANSAATLRFPQMHLDMCRVGIVQYYVPRWHCTIRFASVGICRCRRTRFPSCHDTAFANHLSQRGSGRISHQLRFDMEKSSSVANCNSGRRLRRWLSPLSLQPRRDAAARQTGAGCRTGVHGFDND